MLHALKQKYFAYATVHPTRGRSCFCRHLLQSLRNQMGCFAYLFAVFSKTCFFCCFSTVTWHFCAPYSTSHMLCCKNTEVRHPRSFFFFLSCPKPGGSKFLSPSVDSCIQGSHLRLHPGPTFLRHRHLLDVFRVEGTKTVGTFLPSSITASISTPIMMTLTSVGVTGWSIHKVLTACSSWVVFRTPRSQLALSLSAVSQERRRE